LLPNDAHTVRIQTGLVDAAWSESGSERAEKWSEMRFTTDAEGSADQLAGALARIATNPQQTHQLHEILGHFAHQCRNLLNSMKISLYLADRAREHEFTPRWRDLETRYLEVERFFERVQLFCRPMPLTLVNLPLNLLIEERAGAWTDVLRERGRRLRLVPPPVPPVGRFDPTRLGQGLDDVVAWRARLGDQETDLRLAWMEDSAQFHLVWDEPVRGDSIDLTTPLAGSLTEQGVSSSRATDCSEALTALTVPLLSRIVSLHGGSLEATSLNPWRLDLRWPLDVAHTP
jgi:hypothetical protein